MEDKIVYEFKRFSTSTLSDALDKVGVEGACHGIFPLKQGISAATAGRAFTIKYGPAGVEKGTVGDYIDEVNPGQMIVLDNAGRTDCTVWGDILTTVASIKGIAGTVIDGVCRDVERYLELNYPLFSRGFYMRTGKDRVQVEGVNVPVQIGQIRVAPGDIVIGDSNGVIVIPKEIEDKVLEAAKQIENSEDRIRDMIQSGMRLDEARKKMKYHKLQRG